MSRAQQGQVFSTGQAENKNYNADANSSFSNAQGDITGYGDALSAFKAANPYVTGGAAETAENQSIADTAAAGSQAAGEALQSQAVRTGQNAGGAIAATENIAEQNDRNLMSEEAKATEQRLGAGTGYGEAVLSGTGTQEGMQASLADQEAKTAQGALGSEEQAAQTPSFLDELGQGLIQTGVGFASGFGTGLGKKA